MKFKITKEWLEKRAALDEKAEVTAGAPSLDALVRDTAALRQTPYEQEQLASAFGWLIRSRRLELRFSIERLAKNADLNESVLEEIENDVHYTPEPRTVYQLARALKLPAQRLMQLAGHVIPTDSQFTGEVVRFAARAKRIDELNEDQHEVLREFVKYLAKQ